MKKILTIMLMLAAFAVTGTAQDTWTVAGTAAALNGTTDWAPENTENDMTSSDGVNYTLTVENCTLEKDATYQYKVVKNHAWGEEYPSSNKTFSVTETAIYTVVYTFNADTKEVSEETSKTGEAGVITHTYTVAGVAALMGSSWNTTDTNNDMTFDEGLGLYKLQKDNVRLTAGSYEFKVVEDHAWGVAYPSSNWVLNITESADYNILFTFNATTHDITCTPTQISKIMSIGATGWGTWYTASNGYDFSGVGFSAYTATESAGVVTLTKVNDVQDKTAVVLKGDEGDYYVPFTTTSSTDRGQLQFYDDYAVTSTDEYYVYGLVYDDVNGKAKFAKVNEGQNVGGHVILRVLKSSDARLALEVVFADETTGISSVNAEANNGAYYNLQGIRVAQPTKGLYIVNGKKMLVK